MDLENFDTVVDLGRKSKFSPDFNIDKDWYIPATRRARWMDLIGDYAGNELFVVDGECISTWRAQT